MRKYFNYGNQGPTLITLIVCTKTMILRVKRLLRLFLSYKTRNINVMPFEKLSHDVHLIIKKIFLRMKTFYAIGTTGKFMRS